MYKYLNSPFLKYLLGIIELLFVIAFILKGMAASIDAPFVKGLYTLTNAFSAPFKGMFHDKPLSNSGYWDMSIFSGIVMYAIFVGVPILLHKKYKKDRPKESVQKDRENPSQPV